MSFEYEGTVTTSASPKDVWHLWSDVGSWHCWDPSVQQVCMEGHFAEGAAGTMTLTGGVEAPFSLEIVEPNSRFLDRVTMGDLVIAPRRHVAMRAGRDLELTRREFELLETFARHPRQVLSRDQLLAQVWGYTFDAETNVADVFFNLAAEYEAQESTS